MLCNGLSLGIDTSNYKTSVAIVRNDGYIICNLQQYLKVKKGDRGLRQSAALFQHVLNLPVLIEEAMKLLSEDDKLDVVAVSSRPRPLEGSYMPVFNGGLSAGRIIAASLKVPLYEFSHQEGHIEAVKEYSSLKGCHRYIAFHFSGGTTEALLVDYDKYTIVGGTKDIAFGQVLDRIGVAMGLDFPCGNFIDNFAVNNSLDSPNTLPRITVSDGYFNLSGIESHCQRLIDGGIDNRIFTMVMENISQTIRDNIYFLSEKYNITDFLLVGGVASSKYLRSFLESNCTDMNIVFGDEALSTDNAVGIALLGGGKIWG